MKKFFAFSAVIALAALVSCQKQQTEAEKNAEVERQVQERLAAEHQAEQQQQLSQREAELAAREKALAEKESAPATTLGQQDRSESQPVTRSHAVSGARPTSGYSTFYTKLEPHGAWLETADYGYVWQPRQAESSRSWRPYTNGRWVYTDVGWTWISEEPFGWATYHYGRWTRLHGIGWVWVPGNEWAPAWVSWRKSNDYVGWAPLPPEARFDQRTGIHNWSDNYYDIGPDQYCFVPTRELGAQRIESTIVPSERNLTIVNQTTNVTNITYNNTTVVNEGPNYEEMRAQSREPMQRFRLERNVGVDANLEAPRSLVQGQTVTVAAPVFSAPQANERPRAVKQNVTQVTVDLGWAAIGDHEAAKKTRDKMKSEAAPPSNAPSKKFIKTMSASNPTTEAGSTTSSSSTATPLPSAMVSATQAPSVAATSTPEPKFTPRRAAAQQSSAPATTATPTSSASPLPTASQRRGRLMVPSATPAPRTTPSATPKPAASSSPIAEETVSSRITPAPSVSPGVPSQTEATRGKFRSQAQKFNPRETKPMSSASPSPTVTSTSAPNAASTSSTSSEEKLTKQERKEQKREEKKELKRERKEGAQPGASASPSATP